MLLFSYNTILYSNQILFAVLNEQKSKKIEKKNLGWHREVLVKYILLMPLLTKCNKVKVNLLAGNLKNAII